MSQPSTAIRPTRTLLLTTNHIASTPPNDGDAYGSFKVVYSMGTEEFLSLIDDSQIDAKGLDNCDFMSNDGLPAFPAPRENDFIVGPTNSALSHAYSTGQSQQFDKRRTEYPE